MGGDSNHRFLQIALDLTIYLAKQMSKNIIEHYRMLCSLVMHGQHPSSTRQTVLVLRIH